MTNNVSILLEHKDSIKFLYVDGYKKYYYLILTGFIVDYKEHIVIIDIKANMWYSIYYIL